MTRFVEMLEARDADLYGASIVRRGVRALVRQLRTTRANHGVSPSKLAVLSRLMRAGAVTAAQLAMLERIQPQSLTRLIGDLEARGLVLRRADLHDRRQILIEITPAAVELLRNDARAQDMWLAQAMSRALTPTESEILKMAALLMERLSDLPPQNPGPRSTGGPQSS